MTKDVVTYKVNDSYSFMYKASDIGLPRKYTLQFKLQHIASHSRRTSEKLDLLSSHPIA